MTPEPGWPSGHHDACLLAACAIANRDHDRSWRELRIRNRARLESGEVVFDPAAQHSGVVGVPDPRLGERTCACLVPKPGQSITFDEITAFLRDKIATYKLPEYLEIVDALPRTPTGKIQKGPLRDMVVERMRTTMSKPA